MGARGTGRLCGAVEPRTRSGGNGSHGEESEDEEQYQEGAGEDQAQQASREHEGSIEIRSARRTMVEEDTSTHSRVVVGVPFGQCGEPVPARRLHRPVARRCGPKPLGRVLGTRSPARKDLALAAAPLSAYISDSPLRRTGL
jgi:RNA polymerase-binding transcription factor DksA